MELSLEKLAKENREFQRRMKWYVDLLDSRDKTVRGPDRLLINFVSCGKKGWRRGTRFTLKRRNVAGVGARR